MANLNIGNSTANVKVTLNQNGDVHFRNGSLDFDSSSLPQFSGTPQYLVGIESFANGGTLKWAEKTSVSVGSADKFTSAKSITLTGDVTGTTSSQAGWSIVTTTNKLTSAGHLDTVEKLDAFIESNKLKFATVASIGGVASDGMIISVPWNNSWGHQVFLDDSAMVMQHRHRYTKTNSDGSTVQAWSGWATLIDSNNYTNYTVTKTGSGASGTWGINISGNAATATKLATTRTISLTGSVTGSGTFDGSGNLSITTTTNHTHSVATTSANGLMSSSDKSKLDGIAIGANKYTHPTYTAKSAGFYKVTVDGTGHVSAATAVTKADITGLGIPAQDTTYGVATTSTNGLMSSTDKTKLDGIATGANKYTHPTSHAATMITQDSTHRFVTDTEKSTWNAKVGLDSNGFIPSSVLPSYVDDVIEGYYNSSKFYKTRSGSSGSYTYSNEIIGETGKIYINLENNKTYRWSGSTYAVISETLALGETSSTAYAGNKGKANANNITNIINGTTKVGKAGNADTVNGLTVQTAVPVNAVFTDTVYTHPTSSGNKHIPSGGSAGQILRWSADGTAVWGADNNTTYSANTGIKLNGTTFQHTNSVTAGTAQGDASKTLTFGGTFTIPTITYDAQGHITGKGTTTMTMPANPNTDTKVTQTVTTSNAAYPLLLSPSGQTTTTTTTSYFDSGVTLNPSTNTIAANISGNAATATNVAWSGITNKPPYYDIPRYTNYIGYYGSPDTHILQLGYWNCSYSYDNLTILVSSSFWGNQHGSTDIITLRQDLNDNASGTVHCSCNRVKLMDSNRTFYYNIDQTNRRVYLYVYVSGGNSYGKWNISVLQSDGGSWVSEFAANQPNQSSFVTISETTATATNADTVDGYHESSFLRYSGWWYEGNSHNVNDASGMIFAYNKHGLPGSWGVVTTFDYSKNSEYRHQIYGDGWHNVMYFRTRSSDRGGWNAWKHLWAEGESVTGAVWNDYAEYREADTIQGGRCVREVGDDTLTLTTKRLMRGCSITSDTWGFAQGETEKAKTPIAVAGRVLAYPLEDRELFKEYIGYSVCSGPDGTVSLMTEEEELKYPWAIVGTVSAVPDYEEWGGGEMADRPSVKVDGRIWIKVR